MEIPPISATPVLITKSSFGSMSYLCIFLVTFALLLELYATFRRRPRSFELVWRWKGDSTKALGYTQGSSKTGIHNFSGVLERGIDAHFGAFMDNPAGSWWRTTNNDSFVGAGFRRGGRMKMKCDVGSTNIFMSFTALYARG
ncbi:hypothetical protein CPB86DRAFT_790856 [Serendipita vermifera]|nr:hypothetical protein CPB86DRAFT_790856 [Serendipita vermifera]